MQIVTDNTCFCGRQLRFEHTSTVLGCVMHASIYLPPQAAQEDVPVLYWLSGLTCTDENFVTKAGAQRYAAEHGVAIVAPDTSPRGDDVPDDPEGAWDFGSGAGFYVNATQMPWAANYQMYDYVQQELPDLINNEFPVDPGRVAISGHSMGGHGALTIGLRNPDMFRSISAFAPICSPLNCPWGEKALANYLGEDRSAWTHYDAATLMAGARDKTPVLVDQGSADDFLNDQLKPELLQHAADSNDYPLQLRMQPGYDHSYFFISSFIGEHIAFHAAELGR